MKFSLCSHRKRSPHEEGSSSSSPRLTRSRLPQQVGASLTSQSADSGLVAITTSDLRKDHGQAPKGDVITSELMACLWTVLLIRVVGSSDGCSVVSDWWSTK